MIHLQYLRKSRDRREREDPDVLRRHRTILLELARSDGVVLKAEYSFEEVKSGEHISARPEFQRLLAVLRSLPDCPSDKAQGVLYCIDADRLARGILTERGEVQELLIRKGILIRTPAGLTDLRNPDERLLHNVKGALAEWELGKYRERVARTRALQVRQGQVRNGSVPFGYDWDYEKKRPRPHPTQFPILQRLVREAFSQSVIALSREYGLPTSTVHRALTSPMICGYPARTVAYRQGTKLPRYLPREQWVWPEQEGEYPAAISREGFLALQEVLRRRRKGREKRSKGNDWCRDVLQFAGSGRPARLSSAKSHREGMQPTYELSGPRVPNHPFILRAEVHTVAEAVLAALLGQNQKLLACLHQHQQKQQEKAPDAQALARELDRLRERLARLKEEAGDGDEDDREANHTAQERVKGELRRVRTALQAAQRAAANRDATGSGQIIEALELAPFEQAWAKLTDEGRRRAVGALIERIVVSVEWRPESRTYHRQVRVEVVEWARALLPGD